MEKKELKVNLSKTKLIVGGERHSTKVTKEVARASKDVGLNLMQCTNCERWVHKICSGVQGSLCQASKSFVCSVCLCPTNNGVKFCVDIV